MRPLQVDNHDVCVTLKQSSRLAWRLGHFPTHSVKPCAKCAHDIGSIRVGKSQEFLHRQIRGRSVWEEPYRPHYHHHHHQQRWGDNVIEIKPLIWGL